MILNFSSFSGQGATVSALQEQIRRNRFPQAALITGVRGVGKRSLAETISAALLCTREGEQPCGQCRACLLAQKGEHPDLMTVQADSVQEDGKSVSRKTIPISSIREIISLCSVNTLDQGNRVIRIWNAETMTPQAQNALLKTLEEPPDRTFFLLTANDSTGLLPTILSRCRMIRMKPWSQQTIESILRDHQIPAERISMAVLLSNGSIGEAIRLGENESFWQQYQDIQTGFLLMKSRSEIFETTAAWKDHKTDAELLFTCLESEIRRMLLVRTGIVSGTEGKVDELWQPFVRQAELACFTGLLDSVALARKRLQANVNFQAIIEQLCLSIIGERERWRK